MEDQQGFVASLKSFVHAYFERIVDLARLANLEAQLAAKTLVIMLLLGFCVCCLVLAGWIALLAILYTSLLALQLNALIAAILVAIFNFGLLAIILVTIVKLKKNLTFPATRQHLAMPIIDTEEVQHEPAKKRHKKS